MHAVRISVPDPGMWHPSYDVVDFTCHQISGKAVETDPFLLTSSVSFFYAQMLTSRLPMSLERFANDCVLERDGFGERFSFCRVTVDYDSGNFNISKIQ